MEFQLPGKVALSWIQKWQLKAILKDAHYILLFYVTKKGEWALLPLAGASWNTLPARPPPEAPLINRLYPAITSS